MTPVITRSADLAELFAMYARPLSTRACERDTGGGCVFGCGIAAVRCAGHSGHSLIRLEWAFWASFAQFSTRFKNIEGLSTVPVHSVVFLTRGEERKSKTLPH